MRALLAGLLLFLAGCLPVAVLRPPEPVAGRSLVFGLSALGSGDGVALVPYAAYAQGDGSTEFNLSVQLGLRAGLKQAVAPGVALDLGLTLPPFVGQDGVPLSADAGLLLGLGSLYLSPRVHWLGFQSQDLSVSGFLYQGTLGYLGEGFLAEVGVLWSPQGGSLFSLSGAVRF
ncbi:hypothetical protein [Thermus thalpophilus]|uniref:hypothetical protein n=1 Tax=Thermus thalpophilus TaxID=2908147 RepID=UPI001FAA69AE|nr:hypothetical protein [Thermus thalpophilus]